jgi:hypothetical protein
MFKRNWYSQQRQTVISLKKAYPGMLSLEILMALTLVAALFVGIARFQLQTRLSQHEALTRLQALQGVSSYLEQRLRGETIDSSCNPRSENSSATFLCENGAIFAKEPVTVVRVTKEYGAGRRGRVKVEMVTVLPRKNS